MVKWIMSYIILRNSDGNLHVAYLNWNDDAWVLNFNWLDNDWNENDRLVACEFLCFLPRHLLGEFCYNSFLGAEFSLNNFIHPPIIRPISVNGIDRVVSLLVSISFISQSSFIKNLSVSNFALSCSISSIFLSFGL